MWQRPLRSNLNPWRDAGRSSMESPPTKPSTQSYAVSLADESYGWYRLAAIRSRRCHRASAVAIQVIAATIPVSAAIAPANAVIPAVLGAVVVVLSSVRAIFNWGENYLRFSIAREKVDAQRRLYKTSSIPYDDVCTRDQILAQQISTIENDEMRLWLKVVAGRQHSY